MATPSDKYLGGELTSAQSAAVEALTESLDPAQISSVLPTLSPGGWGDIQSKRMRAAVPDLTYVYATPTAVLPLADVEGYVGWAVSSTLDGGGRVSKANVWTRVVLNLIANPSASHWAFSGRIKIGPHYGQFGLLGGGPGVLVQFLGATTGLYGLRVAGPDATYSSSVSIDSGFHDVMVTHDGTAIRLFIDGVEAVSVASSGRLPTSPGAFGLTCIGSAESMYCTDLAWGIVR